MKIVFCGTPVFSLPSLDMLVHSGHQIVGVFSQPDRPVGRKALLQPPPVKEYALEKNLPLFQFEDIRKGEAMAVLRDLAPELMVTASFGQILSQENLDVAPLGCINVHASLLPKYRGASPIQGAIIAGETITGVTTMYTVLALDAGDMLLQKQLEIGREETAGELSQRLAQLGAQTLKETLDALEAGELVPVPQDESKASKTRMLKKKDGAIDWHWPAGRIHNLLRGCNPWPAAHSFCRLRSGELIPCKFWRSRVVELEESVLFGEMPGDRVSAEGKAGFYLQTGEGVLEILEIQKSGGKRMSGRDFLRGHDVTAGVNQEEMP